ncbi:lipid-A-disaccharide synthase [Calditrichota bacterium GD2]
MTKKNILLIAGEVSADHHGAHLLEALKTFQPQLEVWGIGGDELQKQGMTVLYHVRQMSFLGVGEVLKHLPFIRQVMKAIKNRAQKDKPDAAILIDYPGFNLRLAKALKKMNIPVIYYISPQLWAWGRGRVKTIKQCVDLMLVLFPFEKEFYEQHGIKAQYVGHPLVDRHHQFLPKEFKKVKPGKAVIGLLPGSRQNEIKSLLPRMVKSAGILIEKGAVEKVVIARVPHLHEDYYRQFLQGTDGHFELVEKPMQQLLPELDAALVASGTATLETAYYAVPMVIVYHVNALTYWLGRLLIKVSHIGLANIVAQEEIAPELIQHEFTPQKAADLMFKVLNPQVNEQLRKRMLIVRQKLGQPGASLRAAEHVHRFLSGETN